ncbi:MAG: hypothetical protein ACMV1D_09870 [Macromonas sp.]
MLAVHDGNFNQLHHQLQSINAINNMAFNTGQLDTVRNAQRLNVVACGQYFGKTAMGLAMGCHTQ